MKYHNVKTEYKGELYDSKKEASYAWELAQRLRSKKIKGYERQVRIPLDVNNIRIGVYVADFVVTHLDDTLEIQEVKGMRTTVFNLKWKLVGAIYKEKYKLLII